MMPKVARFQMPDGRIARFEVPDDYTPEQAQAEIELAVSGMQDQQPAQQAIAPQQATGDVPVLPEQQGMLPDVYDARPAQQRTAGERIAGGLEAGASALVSGVPAMIGQTVGAAEGALQYLADGDFSRPPGVPGGVVETRAMQGAKRMAAPFMPPSEAGREYLQNVGEAAAPLAALAPMQGELAALSSGARQIAGTRLMLDPEKAAIVKTGDAKGVRVLNTDVNPPKTFVGKLTQSLSEKMGPLGSGSARAKQQAARQNVVEDLAREFDIDLQSPYAEQVIKSLKSENARKLAAAGERRNSAVTALNEYGPVPLQKTMSAIDRQIQRQERLGDRADAAMIERLNNTKAAIEGGDFSLVKDIRTEVIDDIKALSRSEDSRGMAAMQAVKSAIDDDMLDFAKASDRKAASDWIRSNREFADEFMKTRNTELKRVLKTGDVTPENVLTLLRGGKTSELKRLKSSLDQNGIKNARAAIVRDILDESGYFRGDVNPNRVATALGKTKRQQAIDVFFDEAGKTELDGLRKLLDATRRAQDAAATPPTGVQLVPITGAGAVGAGIATNPLATMAAAGTLTAIAKAYESRAMRNLLMRIGRAQTGSKAEKAALDAAATALLAESLASTEQRQKTTEPAAK